MLLAPAAHLCDRSPTFDREVPIVTGRMLEVPQKFSRSAIGGEWETASAAWLIERMCERVGLADLSNVEVLDMGCGVKFTKLFLNQEVAIKRYVGIDVYREMIEFLRENVEDPRFEYFYIDVKNDKYNPGGVPFTEELRLPVGDQTFDLICLFSVFTHLAPPDYRTMLKLLRRHVRADGRLFFTLYINELTAGGHGLMDAWVKNLAGSEGEFSADVAKRLTSGLPAVEPFVDLDPVNPLKWAVYSEQHARELIDGTGWTIDGLSEPDVYIQHHIVCAPV
jgi:SAM-dependent methyltransferase